MQSTTTEAWIKSSYHYLFVVFCCFFLTWHLDVSLVGEWVQPSLSLTLESFILGRGTCQRKSQL